MAERATVNLKTQAGVESTPGTAVPANKSLDCFSFSFGIESKVDYHRATGKKYPSIQELNQEWMSGSLDESPMDYNGLVYPVSGVFGTATITSSGASSIAKDWTFTPPTTGNTSVKTFSFEQGDAVRAHKFAYGMFTQWGYKGSREQWTTSGTLIGQILTDNATMTSSPTAIALAPMLGTQFDVYIDPTYSALGTTKLSRSASVEYNFDSAYGPAWFINSAVPSWTTHVDMVPNCTLKLELEADAQGMDFLNKMRDGSTQFIRVKARGALLDNLQTVTLGSPSAGTFTLTYKGQTTSGIAFNAASSAVQSALQGLSTVGSGNALVTGSNGGPYTVQFTSSLATDATALTGNGAGLTGGTFAVAQAQVYNGFQHDMAVKVGSPDKYSDRDGLVDISWNLQIVEDAGWSKAQVLTLTNLLTAL
jgi:hypothetical protein